MYLPIAAAAAE